MSLFNRQLQYQLLPYLAKALFDLFPKIELLEGGVGDYGFYYDCISDSVSFEGAVLDEVREKISSLIRDGLQVSRCEMLRDNAVALLLSRGERGKAARLESGYTPGVLSFLRMGEVFEVIPFDVDAFDVSQLRAFDIFTASVRVVDGVEVTRIEGAAFSSLRELKEFRKRRKSFHGESHLTFAEELSLYRYLPGEGEGVWLPRGLILINLLIDRWREFCRLLQVKEVKTASVDEEMFVERVLSCCGVGRFGELLSFEREGVEERLRGMYRLRRYFTDRVCFVVREGEVASLLNSCLQFIAETVNILCCGSVCQLASRCAVDDVKGDGSTSLSHWLVAALEKCGLSYSQEVGERDAEVQFAYIDALGKGWSGPTVSLKSVEREGEQFYLIVASLFGSFERAVAALLEEKRGVLPFYLNPVQLQLVAMAKEAEYARSVKETLEKRGLRVDIDVASQGMGERIHRVEKERPFSIAVVGEREAKKSVVTLRRGAKKEELITINELLDRMHRENSECNFWSSSTRPIA